ncbi:hypothetical protein ACFY3U_13835 [Micromonospora sp. NPDC000089]|uniref:hypothetical protein n=1 Tax=unclassified Micromonospora TaxID=2617518 RepID=UPI0036BB8CC9
MTLSAARRGELVAASGGGGSAACVSSSTADTFRSMVRRQSSIDSKEGPFAAVLADVVQGVVDQFPPDAAGLPGYAVHSYDEYLERPKKAGLSV